MTTSSDVIADPKVLVGRRGACATFTLNRPKALNAFDDEMRAAITDEIPSIARNPDIYIVAFMSGSDRAFCAGGDVRALTALAKTDLAAAKRAFAAEYGMNWLLECFSKPAVSFIDGICMGSGAGLTLFNTHRVAGERYRFAMPETAIGLFPDVGVAHPLSRLPWPVGLYLGLTGRQIDRADAYALGLATHCIAARHFETILAAMAEAEPIDPVLDGLHEAQETGALARERPMIEDFFSGGSLAAIIEKLSKPLPSAKPWAENTLAELRKKSPLSLAITDWHIRSCRSLDLRETLIQDYRLAVRCLEATDFAEGVRAALIDKDGDPHWRPARLEDVKDEQFLAYFAPLGDQDLQLPTRAEMQASRV